MSPVCEVQDNRRKSGLANILAIGTANPPQAINQSDFADYYFEYTNCEHMTELKSKFEHICEKTTIKQRYMHGTKEMLRENPHLCDFNASSLDTRHELIGNAVPKLGSEAATKAIEEWGQPKSKITHLIFCTTVAFDIPGPDYELVRLLGLNDSVKRYMMCMQGCHAGGTVLRLAKDLAENTHGARVLVVCSEVMLVGFRGPTEGHLASMVAQSLFADGAGAVIVGAHPDESSGERPIYELVSASQKLVPDTKGAIGGHLRETGLAMELKLNVPYLISTNIEKPLAGAFEPIGIDDWNSIFWIVHPGGPPILSQIEAKLKLNKSKLSTSFHVLKEFGNMSSASVLFILNETRKRSVEERKATTGDGLDYGVLFGLGPGMTIETIVLRSYPLDY